jgi:pimeloyl-ACP methyl ester carboxylesterase
MSSVVALLLIVAAAPPSFTPCTLSHPSGTRVAARCGAVAVDVDGAPGGEFVDVGYAVLSATGSDPKGGPIALLAGGPGESATRDFAPELPRLTRLREQHDLVLVDVRGTGRSRPQQCQDTRPLPERLADIDGLETLPACIAGLTLDPRFITTRDAARDVDAVRAAVGVDAWDIVGVSYGTRLALIYDQMFPGRARTLTLDGFAAIDRALGADVAADMTAALRAVSPAAVDDFVAAKRALAASPQTVTVAHPSTGAPVTFAMTAQMLNSAVRMALYSDVTRAILPPLLRDARAGRVGPLAAQVLMLMDTMGEVIHAPVNASVLCAEDVPYFDAVDASAVDANAVDANVFDDERANMTRMCAAWPKATTPRPTLSSAKTPTLILSGAQDPITPPHHAERVLGRFVDVKHVVAPGLGHHVLPYGCVVDVVADFIAAGTTAGLAVDCVSELHAFPNFVDLVGPAP